MQNINNNLKKIKNYINIQFKLAWVSSYFVNQINQTRAILIFSSINFIKRLGITSFLLLIIYVLSNFNIHNQDFSNLRWALIGTFASTIATIIFLDAYNRFFKFDAFGILCERNIENIFFNLNLGAR